MTRQQLIANEKADLGYKESPRGSNRTKYGRELGINGQPWCATFQVSKHLTVGVDLRKYSDNPYYTPNLFKDLSARGWAVPESQAVPGDLVFMGFAGHGRSGIEHVGALLIKLGNTFVNIEGNTGARNQANGGMVMQRARTAAQVLGVIHIPESILPNTHVVAPYNPPPVMTPASTVVLSDLLRALFYVKQIVVGPGMPNPPEAVKFVQQGINGAHIPGLHLLVDGLWGPATLDAVKWFQGTHGLVPDGIVGPATWQALYP